MDLGLQGRVAVVTGASKGIGLAVTKALVAEGVDVGTARQQIVESQGGFATGRFTRPDEVADLVLLLASDRAGNVTGSDFVIDGGLIKTL